MNFIKNLIKNPLFHVSSLNSLSVLVRIAGGLLASKIIALFLGPGGIAVVGNFRNFLTSLEAFSTLGFQNGIIKFVAENEKDEPALGKILSTVFLSILGAILILSLLLFFTSGYLNTIIFGPEHDHGWVFKVVALSLPWYAGSFIFMAVINGLGKYKSVIVINIWGNVIGVLLSAVLIWKLNITGAFLGLIVTPAFLFLFSFYLLQKRFKAFDYLKIENFDHTIFRGLLSYSFMSLITALLAPFVYVSIRNTITVNFSLEEAGYWEGMNRISVFYLMFITTMLSVYFLPKLSMAKDHSETKSIFWSYYKVIVPMFIAGALATYLLREFIVGLLFSKEFLPMANLFFWQLMGDLFKVCSLILGYQFFAKKMTKAFVITEILSLAVLYISSQYFIQIYGSEGAVMAHTLTYIILFFGMVIYFRKQLFGNSQ
ncbi:MAG: O-antigen translocase [Flavobacterium sp.]|nr:MAG: O-antigen translocase [Flavobacterium sp.]